MVVLASICKHLLQKRAYTYLQVKVLVVQYCLTLCNPMDCSLPGSSVQGILQARILEWVAIPFSRESSWPRDWPWVPSIASRFLTIWTTRKAPYLQIFKCACVSMMFYSLLYLLGNIFFLNISFLFSHLQCASLTSVDDRLRGWSKLHFSQAFIRDLNTCFQSRLSLDDSAFESTRLHYVFQVLIGSSTISTQPQSQSCLTCHQNSEHFLSNQPTCSVQQSGFSQPAQYPALWDGMQLSTAIFRSRGGKGEPEGFSVVRKTWQKLLSDFFCCQDEEKGRRPAKDLTSALQLLGGQALSKALHPHPYRVGINTLILHTRHWDSKGLVIFCESHE